MNKPLGLFLASVLVTGCSVITPGPGPDLADFRQTDPPWRIVEDLASPVASPLCEFATADYEQRDRVVLSVLYEERFLPLGDCTVEVPVDKGPIRFHLFGRFLKPEVRTYLPAGRLSNGYQIDLNLGEGETISLRLNGVGEGGSDVTYTLRGIETSDYRIDIGPSAEGPWRTLTNGEVIDPTWRFVRLRFPRQVSRTNEAYMIRHAYDYSPAPGKITWLDGATMLFEAEPGVSGLHFAELMNGGGFAVKPAIHSVYFGSSPRLVRLTPRTGEERELVQLSHAPFFTMRVLGGALYQNTGDRTWRIDLASGERSEAQWPQESYPHGYPQWDRSPDGRHSANWEYTGWEAESVVRFALELDSEQGYARVPDAAGVALVASCDYTGPSFAWSPDSTALALKDVLSEHEVSVVLLDLADHNLRTLVTLNASWRDAARWMLSWSPDSKHMVLGPHLIDVQTGRVVTTSSQEGTVTWSENGRYLRMNRYVPHVGFGVHMTFLDTHDPTWIELGYGLVLETMPDGDLLVVRWAERSPFGSMKGCH